MKKFIFLLVLLALLVYFRWLSFGIFTSGDSLFYYSDFLKSFIHPSVWSNSHNLGLINVVLWRFPIGFANGLFGILGFSINISEKFLYFWPTLIFANIASFLLVRKVTKSNLAGFVGAIIFNYNTYYFVGITAFLIYAAAPWVIFSLLFFMKSLEKKSHLFSLLSLLFLFVAGSYDFRVAYIGVFLLLFYFIFYYLIVSRKMLRKSFLLLLEIIVGFAILNIYWVLPMLKLGSLTSNSVLDRTLFGNEFLNVLYSISFYHPFWTGTKTAYFHPQQIMAYFWLIPIFAFLGLYLNRKNKNILFFGIITLLGIFLTKQVGHPFPNIYPFLFEHVPGFNAFREASKFYFLIALSYSVLIGAFISWIWKNWKIGRSRVYGKYFLLGLTIFVFLWNTLPIFTGSIQSLFIERHIPKDYIILKDFIANQDQYYRTLWIPSSSTWSFYTDKNPRIKNISLLNDNLWNKFITTGNYIDTDKGRFYIKYLNQQHMVSLLNLSSVKYIVVPLEDKQNHAELFIYYGKNRQYYIDELDKINYLNRINIGTKEIAVYENYNYRPHVYATAEKETIYKDLRPTIYDVRSKFITPTQYQVSINNVKEPFYLNFSESYHPQWKLYLGDFKWYNILFNKQKSISDKDHLQNDATLNSYFLDPKQVCLSHEALAKGDKVNDGCVRNKDGSYDIDMTLYFAPQSWLYLGLIISGSTLVLVLRYLIFILSGEARSRFARERDLYDKRKN